MTTQIILDQQAELFSHLAFLKGLTSSFLKMTELLVVSGVLWALTQVLQTS